jgi:large subunit ribosomal protein L17e
MEIGRKLVILLFLICFCVAAQCRANDLRVHFKNTYETARAVRGMNLHKALAYLERVLEHKSIIPFRRFNDGIGRKAMSKNVNFFNGRFPEKSVKHVMSLLKNLKSNAEAKGLDTEKCVISHVATQRAVQGRRRTYRAHGRISPYLSSNCHIEFHVTEKSGEVARADKQKVRLTKKQVAKQRLAVGN